MSDLGHKNELNKTPAHGIRLFGTELVLRPGFFRRLKRAVSFCIIAMLIIGFTTAFPTAYAAWYNDNAVVSEVSVGGAGARAIAAENEPGDLEEIVSVLSDSSLEYIVYVNGIEAGSIESIEKLNTILSDIIAEFSTENTVSAEISETITTKCVYSESTAESDEYLLRSALDPNNEDSPCKLTVTTVDTETAGKTIPHQKTWFESTAMDEGTTQLITEGVDGYQTMTVTSTRVNGVETSSEITDVRDVVAPVAEITAVGTRPLTASRGYYIWPAEGIMTSDFGPRNVRIGSSFHKGIDIVGSRGQNIYAADGGVVTHAQVMSGFGNVVFIQHDNGDVTVYAHNTELLVTVGERVMQGQVIALMGDTGTASAIHCHFELRVGGTQIDPLPYLR